MHKLYNRCLYYAYSDDDKVDATVIKHVIQQHQHRVIQSADEDVQRLHIRRSHLLSDALQQFSRKSFDVTKMLKVSFIGESAVDAGGPRREFFYLVTHEIFKSSFLGFLIMLFRCTMWRQLQRIHTTPLAKFLQPVSFRVEKCLCVSLSRWPITLCMTGPVVLCLEDIADCEVQESLGKVL